MFKKRSGWLSPGDEAEASWLAVAAERCGRCEGSESALPSIRREEADSMYTRE